MSNWRIESGRINHRTVPPIWHAWTTLLLSCLFISVFPCFAPSSSLTFYTACCSCSRRWGETTPLNCDYKRPAVHPPRDTWVWGATMEWYWQGNTDELGEKPVLLPLWTTQVPHGLTQTRTRTSMRRQRLTAWAITRPKMDVINSLNLITHLKLGSNKHINIICSKIKLLFIHPLELVIPNGSGQKLCQQMWFAMFF
jgi:hypothetical protein